MDLQQLTTRVDKLEERVAKTPTYGILAGLLFFIVVIILLIVRIMIPVHREHSQWSNHLELFPNGNSNSDAHPEGFSYDTEDEPDRNFILNRVFHLMERALEIEENKHHDGSTDSEGK
ncbi:MAG: hypothetical protein IPP74_07560 [Alphaproteobacteria bacterium]|nr:hypothetical protein [Alphaproteobacteria bacterium]